MAVGFYKVLEDGVELRIRATPNANKDEITGIETRDDGLEYLKVKIRAAPEDNEANQAIEKLLAKTFAIAKKFVEIKSGHKNRVKILFVKVNKMIIEAFISDIVSQFEGRK